MRTFLKASLTSKSTAGLNLLIRIAGHQARSRRLDPRIEPETLFLRSIFVSGERVIDALAQVEGFMLELHLIELDVPVFQRVVEHLQEVVA